RGAAIPAFFIDARRKKAARRPACRQGCPPHKAHFLGSLPGKFSGFSWTRVRKPELIPAASETVVSPYLSRILSTASSVFRQRSVFPSSSKLVCPSSTTSCCAYTPSRRIAFPVHDL